MKGKVSSSSWNTLSCIQAMYFTCKSESFNRRFFNKACVPDACVQQGFYCSQVRVGSPSMGERLCCGHLAKWQCLVLFPEHVCHSVTKVFYHKQSS